MQGAERHLQPRLAIVEDVLRQTGVILIRIICNNLSGTEQGKHVLQACSLMTKT